MKVTLLLLCLCAPVALTAFAGDPAPTPVLGARLPSVRGTSLAGEAVRLPEDLAGAPAVLLVAYRRGTQSDIDRWMAFLEGSHPGLKHLEVPAIASPVWRPLAGWIDSGMRRGVPQDKWSAVVTLYEDAGELKNFLGDPGGYGALVVLLDKAGAVRWFGTGGFSDEAAGALAESIEAALDESGAAGHRP